MSGTYQCCSYMKIVLVRPGQNLRWCNPNTNPPNIWAVVVRLLGMATACGLLSGFWNYFYDVIKAA